MAEVEKESLKELLDDLISMDYEDHTDDNLKELLSRRGLKCLNWSRHMSFSSCKNLMSSPIDGEKFPNNSFVMRPCEEIDIFIKLGEDFYLPLVLLRIEGNHPVYKKEIQPEYIYILTSKKENRTVFYMGSAIETTLQKKYIKESMRRIRDEVNILNMKILKVDDNKRALRTRIRWEYFHSGEKYPINYFNHENRDKAIIEVIEYVYNKFDTVKTREKYKSYRNALEAAVAEETL